ncbi:MAG: polysaccharide deacetylase family protein [Victivallaceae bacterium]
MVKVVQCWDDGVINDLRLAEMLRKYNAKATFNLNPGLHAENRQDAHWTPKGYSRWSHKGYRSGKLGKNELFEAYSGFQVASHCMKHEVAGTVPDAEFIQSAVDARKFLEDLFQQECRGFAWPCGRYTPSTADALRDAGFAYGRTTENTGRVTAYEHPMILHSSCHFQDNTFYDRYKQAKETDGVFYFWGHSYEMLDSPGMWEQFEYKLQYISEDSDAVWCDVIDIMPPAQ